VITREQAVSIVAARLAVLSALVSRDGESVSFAVAEVRDLGIGWLVHREACAWPSGEPYSGRRFDEGVYLVDADSGALFFVPAVALTADDWIDAFLIRYKGRHVPDAVELRIRSILAAGGRIAAMRELRRTARELSIEETRAYIDAIESGCHPRRLLPAPPCPVGPLDPVPAGFDAATCMEMWTTERAQWYLAMLPCGTAVPIRRGDPGVTAMICDNKAADTVNAHMLEAGVDVVALGESRPSGGADPGCVGVKHVRPVV
jgi:hypothetical protein